MFGQFLPALRMLVVLSVLTGVIYPLRRHRHRPGRLSGCCDAAA